MENDIYGGEGNDTLRGTYYKENIYGGAGDDKIYAGYGDDYVEGEDGNDDLYGGEGDDYLYGEDGNDYLIGEGGNDLLDGGTGNDILDGGYGYDTYVYGKGYGNDRIRRDGRRGIYEVLREDKIILKDLKVEDVRLERNSNDDLIIRVLETNETLTIDEYFKGNYYPIEKIYFADMGSLSSTQIAVIVGTQNGDIVKPKLNIALTYIYGQQGDDTIIGRDAVDIISGGAGADTLKGGNGNDQLDGGSGDDYLEGGPGSDTYIFRRGYGNDMIDNSSSEKTDVDQLILKGLKAEDVRFETTESNDLVIRILETNETLTVVGYFNGGAQELEKICFEDDKEVDTCFKGTEYSDNMVVDIEGSNIQVFGYRGDDTITATAAGNYTIYGGMGNDTIQSGSGDDIIYGEEGNDIIYGGMGNDCIHGGDDDDKVYGGDGNDILYGCSGDDYLDGGAGNDILYGGDGDGDDILKGGMGNDTLYGGAGDDTLYGDEGDDSLQGGIGADTYIFNYDYGLDSIYDKDTDTNNIDTIIWDHQAIDIKFLKYADNLELDNREGYGRIKILSWDLGKEYQIEQIKSSDGMTLVNTQVDALIEAMATFEKEKGMTWNECVNNDREGASALISQFWVK